TAGDRLLQARKREQHRRDYRDALREAQGKIQALAQGLKERFGKYSVDHYYNELVHRAHKSRSTRGVSRWNAFQKLELRPDLSSEENPGVVNLTAVTKEISARWQSLSKEDRIRVTAGCVEEIKEEREAKSLGTHNVPLRAFYDARGTLQSVEKELSQLHARTGFEFFLIASRSKTTDFMKPFIYYSSDVVKGFIADSFGRSIDDFAVQMEAYVITGLKGVAMNSKNRILEIKKKTTSLILEQLRTVTGARITRMEYDRFDDLITEKYDVVVKNWPLKKFCNPSGVTSSIELNTLYNSWKSGATRFQRLTGEEMKEWKSNRFASAMELMPPPPAELVPALALPQSSTEMMLISELPCQDRLALGPTPPSHTLASAPLAPITNLASAPAPIAVPSLSP
ncbi:hypothetical protein BJ322DRAFT_991516, partial [Thelephora terrestris]